MAALNLRSQSYTATTKASTTGTSGATTINVVDVFGIVVGQRVTGTGIGSNAVVSSINTGTNVVTLSVANSGTVSGTVSFLEVTKNAALLNTEIDGNFTELNDRIKDKAPLNRATLTNVNIASGTGSLTSLALQTLTVSPGGSGIPTSGLAGVTAVANGGTNSTATPTNGGVSYGTGTAYAFTGAGTSGQVLTSNGAAAPTWTTLDVIELANDTSNAAATFYPSLVANQTTGNVSALTVSSTKLYFQPSTGTLAATNFNSLSDQRLKNTITPISNATDTVKQLRGTSFNWNDTSVKSYGVIAQELEAVLPELVGDQATKTVNYAGLIAFLIEAVKELDSRLTALEGR